MPKESVTLDLFVRAAPRAPLQRVICWHGLTSRARIWTLTEQVRALLTALNASGYTVTDVTREDELAHAQPGEEWDGNPRP
jgi:hypothetical protein